MQDSHFPQPISKPAQRLLGTLVAACVLCVVYATMHTRIERFNSDLAYLPSLLDDLRSQVNLYWRTPPSPYFFPDALLLALARLTTHDIATSFTLAMLLQATLYLGGCAALAKALSRATMAGIACGGLAVAATVTSPMVGFFWWTPSQHGGLASISPLILAAHLHADSANGPTVRVAAILLLCATAASDPVAYIALIAPLSLAACFLRRYRLSLAVVIFPAVATALLRLLGLAVGLRSPPGISGYDLLSSLTTSVPWKRFAKGFQALAVDAPAGLLLSALATLGCLSFLRMGAGRQRRHHALIVVLAVGSTLILTPLSGVYLNPGENRYLLALFALTPLGILSFAPPTVRPSAALALPGLALAALLARLPPFPFRAPETPYPPGIACIDDTTRKHGAKQGLSTYWFAKWTSQLSKQNIHVIAVEVTGEPDPWIANIAWYQDSTPTFLMLTDAERSTLGVTFLQRFGTPLAKAECGALRLWFWDTPLGHTASHDR